MKKLILFSLALPVALLLSFSLRQEGIKKIGTDLYSVTPSSSKTISNEDKEKIKNLIIEHYHLKDVTGDIVIAANNPINLASNWIFSTSALSNFISAHFITWDKNKSVLDKDGQKARDIITKYAPK